MAKPLRLGDSQAILSRMQQATESTHSLPAPFKGATALSVFRKAVDDGRSLLPARYQQPYVDVLEQALIQAENALRGLGPKATVKRKAVFQQLELVFSALGAPIAQLRSHTYSNELRAFQAVISDVYKHFVDNPQIRSAVKSSLLWPSLDPLGSLNSDKHAGPYTFAATAELPVALISKPVTHATFLPLWLVDGHEVGGHSIYTAVNNFLTEMGDAVEQKVRAGLRSGAVKLSTNTVRFAVPTGAMFGGRTTVSMAEFLSVLWRSWLHEICADAAGLLNMGPMFTNGLILNLALERPNWELSAVSVFDARRGFTEHPADIVRALLSIEMLAKLNFPRAGAYAKLMRERLEEIQMDLPETVDWITRTGTHAVDVKVSDIQAILPLVADAMLNSQLKCLSNKALLNIMPWTGTDEKAVRLAAAALLKGHGEAPDSVQARHVVAGSLMAAESASMFENFDEDCERLHRAGIRMLNDMYSNQCLLCNVQTITGAKDPADVTLKDLVRLVKNMRGE